MHETKVLKKNIHLFTYRGWNCSCFLSFSVVNRCISAFTILRQNTSNKLKIKTQTHLQNKTDILDKNAFSLTAFNVFKSKTAFFLLYERSIKVQTINTEYRSLFLGRRFWHLRDCTIQSTNFTMECTRFNRCIRMEWATAMVWTIVKQSA